MDDYRRFDLLGADFGARLDLVVEASRILRGEADMEIAGISEEIEQHGDIRISDIHVFELEAAKRLGKKPGHYITIDIPARVEQSNIDEISELTAQKISQLLPPLEEGKCILLVGLGNNQATPDALGPQVIDQSYATRHIFALDDSQIRGTLNSLAILAPGVLGVTGIETAEMIRGVASHVKPQAIIVVDSLAAASISRVGTTIQITDSGISPGSGLGNNRPGIDEQTMGFPVIALGVPTVVNSQVIIYEALNNFLEHVDQQGFKALPVLDHSLLDQISNQVLQNFNGSLVVTPKDIDQLVADAAQIIAAAVAQAVHPGVNVDNYYSYLR